MNKQEFIDYICNNKFVSYYENDLNIVIDVQWVTGGQTGASCWDTGEPSYNSVSSEQEPEETILDDILEQFYPNLTFLKYRKIRSKVISYKDDSVGDYYGNYDDIRYRIINLSTLYDLLEDQLKDEEVPDEEN